MMTQSFNHFWGAPLARRRRASVAATSSRRHRGARLLALVFFWPLVLTRLVLSEELGDDRLDVGAGSFARDFFGALFFDVSMRLGQNC